jgi:hypothetical protein
LNAAQKYSDHSGRKAADFGFPELGEDLPVGLTQRKPGWSLLEEDDEIPLPDDTDDLRNLVIYDDDIAEAAPEKPVVEMPVEEAEAPVASPAPSTPVRTATTRPVAK